MPVAMRMVADGRARGIDVFRARAARERRLKATAAAALMALLCVAARGAPADAPAEPLAPADFIAAMQRARLNLPEPPDSAALKAYPIYDYLIAARLRRDLTWTPTDDLDASVDAFLRAREGQPVARALKH